MHPLPFRDIPQPSAHPLLGHFPDWLGVQQARRILQLLLRYARECGPLARVPLGPTTVLAVGDPGLAEQVLSSDAANYKGLAYILTRVVLNNVLLHNGHVWSTHRRLYRDALHGVEAYPAGNRAALALVARWRGLAPGAPLALERETARLLADTTAGFLCGAPFPAELEEDRRRIQYELAAVGIDLQCRPWAYLSPRRWWLLHRAVRRTRSFFMGAVRDRRQGGSAPDVLGGFLRQARQGLYPDDDTRLDQGLVNFFFTAHDVLTSSLSWCLHLLSAHPWVQDRLAGELAGLPPGPLGREQVDGLAFLGLVVKESLRLYPGYPLFGRTTQGPIELGGFAVPSGTLILVSPWVIHRLAQHWPRGHEFDPERFAGQGPGTPSAAVRGAYLPFGSGRRACMASQLAFPLLKLLIAQIIRHVRLAADLGHIPVLAYWGTAYSESGLPARVFPR